MNSRFFILLIIFCFAISANLFSEEQEKTPDTPGFFIGTGIYWGDAFVKTWSSEGKAILSIPAALRLFLGTEINRYIYVMLSATGLMTPSLSRLDYSYYVPPVETGPLGIFSLEIDICPIYGFYLTAAPQIGYMSGQSDHKDKNFFLSGYMFGAGYRFELSENWSLRLSAEYSRFYTHIRYNDKWDKWFENYYLIFGPSVFYRF